MGEKICGRGRPRSLGVATLKLQAVNADQECDESSCQQGGLVSVQTVRPNRAPQILYGTRVRSEKQSLRFFCTFPFITVGRCTHRTTSLNGKSAKESNHNSQGPDSMLASNTASAFVNPLPLFRKYTNSFNFHKNNQA